MGCRKYPHLDQCNNAEHHIKQNMENKQRKNKFTSVDVWRPTFGGVSVKAIFELYRNLSGCTQQEFAKTKFREMVDYLRKLDNPNYSPKQLPINNGY